MIMSRIGKKIKKTFRVILGHLGLRTVIIEWSKGEFYKVNMPKVYKYLRQIKKREKKEKKKNKEKK